MKKFVIVIAIFVGALICFRLLRDLPALNSLLTEPHAQQPQTTDRGPGTAETNVWRDLSGVYIPSRVTDGYAVNHVEFVDLTIFCATSQVRLLQSNATNVNVIYHSIYGGLVTNTIMPGAAGSNWSWSKGRLRFKERVTVQGRSPPGPVWIENECVVDNSWWEGTVTITSTYSCGGKFYWLRAWENPADVEVIKLRRVEVE